MVVTLTLDQKHEMIKEFFPNLKLFRSRNDEEVEEDPMFSESELNSLYSFIFEIKEGSELLNAERVIHLLIQSHISFYNVFTSPFENFRFMSTIFNVMRALFFILEEILFNYFDELLAEYINEFRKKSIFSGDNPKNRLYEDFVNPAYPYVIVEPSI